MQCTIRRKFIEFLAEFIEFLAAEEALATIIFAVGNVVSNVQSKNCYSGTGNENLSLFNMLQDGWFGIFCIELDRENKRTTQFFVHNTLMCFVGLSCHLCFNCMFIHASMYQRKLSIIDKWPNYLKPSSKSLPGAHFLPCNVRVISIQITYNT